MGALESALRARRDAGGRSFVPYLTGGFPGVDAAMLRAVAEAGADAIEVGIPHSDPVMDGGVIQEASSAALAASGIGCTFVGGANFASDLDAKRAIEEGTRAGLAL